MAKKRPESVILDVFFSSILLSFFLGSCNRSLVVQVAYWTYAPNLTKSGKARTKLCMRLIKSMRLTASSA